MLHERLSPHLQHLVKVCPAVSRQFVPSKHEMIDDEFTLEDPLLEDQHTVTRGLVHKYGARCLVLLTMNCAAYCRFCTRRRRVSDIKKGLITTEDLDNMVKYLKKHPEITELIFSGGDPLTVPGLLKIALRKLSNLPQIKVIRVGTRLPGVDPGKINKAVFDALRVVKRQPLYLMVHFEHPDEITPPVVRAVKKLHGYCTMMLSQSVFLRGVNDDVNVLRKLFTRLIEIGVKPYYLFRCDYVKGAEHFIVPFKKEVKIVTELRRKLSGLAFPTYVIDAANGTGKILVPLDFWKFDGHYYTDFTGKKIRNQDPS